MKVNRKAIVIGASAGALDALSAIIPFLPADYPFPVLIVVHLPPDRESLLSEVLQAKCALTVQEAMDKQKIKAGHVYVAPPDYHLLVEKDESISLAADEPVLFSRPSIDVLFETAADTYGKDLIAIILTGANEDGAKGLKAVIAAGGAGIVQNPDQASARMMPEMALKLSPQAKALPLEQIALYLQQASKAEFAQ